MQSSLEAITRAVPLVGIAVFADQRQNLAMAVLEGYGIAIDFDNVTTETLTWAIQEVLESEKCVLYFSSYTF